MNPKPRAALELALAVLAVAGCLGSWVNARSVVQVAPVVDGEPSTTSIAYYPPLLFLALLLAMVAGVLTVLALSRLRRSRRSELQPYSHTR